MVTNNEIKRVRSLLQKKYRNQYGQFVVEGVKLVKELVASDFKVVSVFATRDLAGELSGIKDIKMVTNEQINRMSGLTTSPGILAVAAIPEAKQPEDLSGWTVVLDDLNDPGNVGTILRNADWFGIRRVVLSPKSVDAFNPKVVQASMGAIFRVEVYATGVEDFLKHAAMSGIPVFAADMQGVPVVDLEFPETGILIMGSESHGVSTELQPMIDGKITIPGRGGAESLNVAVAMAVICSRLPIE